MRTNHAAIGAATIPPSINENTQTQLTTFKVDPTIISLSYVAIGLVVVISIFIAVRNHSKHSNTPTAGYPNDQKQMLP
ncbi:hypothetical protein ACT4UT_24310 [Bacillus sp. B-TM1]